MVAPLYAGFALHVIMDQSTGVRGYNVGDGLYQDAIENLGLQVGVDYEPARPDLWLRPADDAPRVDWVAYATSQGMAPADADNVSLAELVAAYPPAGEAAQALPGPALPGSGAHKKDWVKYAVSQGMGQDVAESMTIAELADRYAPAAEPEA